MKNEKIAQNKEEAKADNGKPKLSLVPRQILFDIAKVREFGTKKYGDSENWRQVEVQRYRDAAFRHFMAYLDDPYGVDEESGLSHLSHLACNIAFLCELEHVDEIVTVHNKEALRKAEADIENAKRYIYRFSQCEDDIVALRKELKTDIKESMDAVKKYCENDNMAVQECIQNDKQDRIRELQEELKHISAKKNEFFDIERITLVDKEMAIMNETMKTNYDIIADAVRKFWAEESQHPEPVVVYFYQKYDFDGDDKWESHAEYVRPFSSDDFNTVIFEDDFCEGRSDVKDIHIVSAEEVIDCYQTTILGMKDVI